MSHPAGSLLIQVVSLTGIGLSGLWATIGATDPSIKGYQEALSHGNGQVVLAVWVICMVGLVGTLFGVIRFLFKENKKNQDKLVEHQESSLTQFVAYLEKSHKERDRREDRYTDSVGDMTLALTSFSSVMKKTNEITAICHDKHVMIKHGSCMTDVSKVKD